MADSTRNLTVLVAEDSTSARYALCDFLKKKGYGIIEAKDGNEAVEKAQEHLPDIISLDVDMPELTGFEACRQLRQIPSTQHIPVVFVTGNDTLEDRKRGFELGAVDFISKHTKEFWVTVASTIDKLLRPKITMRDLTALIIDNDDVSRQIINSCLVHQGVHTLIAKDESTAKQIADQENSLDIIITEAKNEEIDGIELCRHFRDKEHLRDIPILLLCSDQYRSKVLEFFDAGATDYLVKPCTREELLARVLIHVESRQLLKDLTNEMNKNQLILDSAGEAIFGVDTTGTVTFANPEAAKIFGYTQDELIGRNLHTQLHYKTADDTPIPEEECHCRKSFTSGIETRVADDVFWHKDGSPLPVKYTSTPIRVKDRITGAVITVSDISVAKREEALRMDVERICRHDLKTPLNGIIGIPSILLNDDNLTEKQKQFLDLLQQSGYRMLSMINESLNLFMMEKGTYEYSPESINLLPMIEKITKELPLLSVRQLSIKIFLEGKEIQTDDKYMVQGEEVLCYSMLANLLKNATEASPKEGTIEIHLSRTNDSCQIKIHNIGAVPKAIRSTFFDKYATAEKKGGTGLGTYSAKLMAKTQGGSIRMESSEEVGTTVTISLPNND